MQIPFTPNGKRVLWSIFNWMKPDEYIMIDNYEFNAMMTITDICKDGGVTMTDDTIEYYMFHSDFCNVVRNKTIIKGVFNGHFTFRKQGKFYGVCCIG